MQTESHSTHSLYTALYCQLNQTDSTAVSEVWQPNVMLYVYISSLTVTLLKHLYRVELNYIYDNWQHIFNLVRSKY